MHLFINSLAATAGGGLTYIRNVLPMLAERADVQVTVMLGRTLRQQFPDYRKVEFVEVEMPALRRFWYEQSGMADVIQRTGADVLLSAGNFAMRQSPVPQILLSRNSIYMSGDYYRDLRSRHEYVRWMDTRLRGWLAKKSVEWADVTVAPSEAFAIELQRWTGKQVRTIHHGFDAAIFAQNSRALSPTIEQKLRDADGAFKLLFVSHYNYYRNFETLFRALPLLRNAMGRPVKLLLTCRFRAEETPGAYRPEAAAKLLQELRIADMVVELGSVPYDQLHHVYQAADIYVTPAYTETFAHPLVEAMASGLPVIASNLAVHREICRDAAIYFAAFSAEALADCVLRVDGSAELVRKMKAAATQRVLEFSWRKHVDDLLQLCQVLIQSNHKGRS